MIQLPNTYELQQDWQKNQGTDLFNPNALQVAAAIEFMRHYTQTFRDHLGEESIPLETALGRILSQGIIAPHHVPSANNSAMDGYAFNSNILISGSQVSLEVLGTQLAGQSPIPSESMNFDKTRHAIRIMTGALMPFDCDTVIPQEFVHVQAAHIEFETKKVRSGENRRLQGEDLRMGEEILSKGRILQASDLGLIASMGYPNVMVKKKVRVAYFSTGNEVTPLGQALAEGGLYDSNRFTLLGLLSAVGCELIDLGIVKDDAELLRAKFIHAASIADAIITSGGVSVGEADFTKAMMRELGDVAFWTLAIKPGRPMAFGKIKGPTHEAVLFGLPGNPVAVMVTFQEFVKDILLHMGGANQPKRLLYQARLDGELKKRPGRTEYVRGLLIRHEHGELWVRPHPNQGSGILRSMSESDCLIVLEASQSEISYGQAVDISSINA
jgi:molybdopterin molybdotransferase